MLEIAVEVVLRKDLAAMGAVVREVLFRVEVGVGAVVRPVGVVAGGPAAHVAPHRRTSRDHQQKNPQRKGSRYSWCTSGHDALMWLVVRRDPDEPGTESEITFTGEALDFRLRHRNDSSVVDLNVNLWVGPVRVPVRRRNPLRSCRWRSALCIRRASVAGRSAGSFGGRA